MILFKCYLLILSLLTYYFSSFANASQYEDVQKCIPFRDTVLAYYERPKAPGDIVSLAQKYCKKGSKMHIDDVPNWWVPYIIYNVCNLKFAIHVERFGTEETPLASVVCLYEGKIRYD